MKDNINKVINLNAFIHELSQDYEIVTYAESSYISYIRFDKIHTLLYHDYDIHIFVQGDNYCFITVNGNRYTYSDFKKFKKRLYVYLDRLYYIDYVIPDILNMIKNHRISYTFDSTLPVWLEKEVKH
jgi:hypothetical protein